jgi:hypothetical protein
MWKARLVRQDIETSFQFLFVCLQFSGQTGSVAKTFVQLKPELKPPSQPTAANTNPANTAGQIQVRLF